MTQPTTSEEQIRAAEERARMANTQMQEIEVRWWLAYKPVLAVEEQQQAAARQERAIREQWRAVDIEWRAAYERRTAAYEQIWIAEAQLWEADHPADRVYEQLNVARAKRMNSEGDRYE